MHRLHIQAHPQVVEVLGGQNPRHVPQVIYQEGHSSQINAPRRGPRSNFRDRSNRRKTTGFEEIRQEYYNIHQNKATAEPEAGGGGHAQGHPGQTMDDSQEYFPKPSAFIRAPRRQLPPRRQRPANVEDNELVGGSGFMNRGSKAADMFQRRRERTDQFILDQENATPTPAAHQVTPQVLTQTSWDAPTSHRQSPSPQPKPVYQSQAPAQPRRTPPPNSRPHHAPQQRSHVQQHPQSQQQHFYPQQQHHQQQQHQQQPQQQPQRRQQPSHGHTTVDARGSRQPLTPKSSRFELNSPWKDPNMPVGNRFHPNVVPYKDSYNVSPKGWGRGASHFGEDNNIKDHYEYTDTSEKFRFTPAPRINKFSNSMTTTHTDNYNSRPKSWCDIELTASHTQRAPPPSRRAYPQQRQYNQSSVNQFTGQSSWGYNQSEDL